jgi:putative ABC transport system permease protein
MDLGWQNLGCAWREARAHPGIALVAVLTLALGIGGSTTMYSMLSGVGMGIAPVTDADRVGRVFASNPLLGAGRHPFSVDEYLEIRSSASAFRDLAAFGSDSVLLEESGATRVAGLTRISPNFYRALGFPLAAGRSFRDDECRMAAARVVIVSERFCRRRWHQPANGLGKTVRFGGEDHTVVGVLRDGLWFPARGADLWAPLELSAEAARARQPRFYLVGRLRPTGSWSMARAEMQAIGARLAEHDPEARRGWTVLVVPLSEDAMKRAGFGLFGLLGPALVVLLIACSNVANLMLARSAGREREMAVRVALGAGRLRLIRERLAESAWIAAIAGALGLLFALWGTNALRAWIDRFKPGLADSVKLDSSALAFALGLTVLTPLVFGLVPALLASRPNVTAALHEAARRKSARRGPYGGRDLLVIVEMTLAVALVVTAGLFGSFVWEMNHIELRFDAEHVLAVDLDVTRASRAGADALASGLVDSVLASVRAIPGVRAAAVAQTAVPLDARPVPVAFEGCEAGGGGMQPAVPAMAVGEGYFAAIGLPIVRGRGIDANDVTGAPLVAVISESLAHRCWPGRDPIGARLRLGNGSAPWTTVVGMARDAMTNRALGNIIPSAPVYVAAAQGKTAVGTVLVRADGDVLALARPVGNAVWAIDRNQPLADVGRVEDLISRQFLEGWMLIGLMAGFAGLALALAAMGVFGVTSYSVAERTREFGIRVAMGATPAAILRLVVGRAMTVVGIGTLAAGVVVIAVTKVVWAELVNLGTHSPMGFFAIAAILAGAAVSACIVPARRATQVDPVVALRAE